jgi:uncharacterized membrane protein YeiH
MAATVAFAVTAVLAIESDKDIDLFGATALGLITAIGGGTIRDVVIDAPVFWAQDLSYVWVGRLCRIRLGVLRATSVLQAPSVSPHALSRRVRGGDVRHPGHR